MGHILGNALAARSQVDFDIIIASDAEDRRNFDRIFQNLPDGISFRFIEHQGTGFDAKIKYAFRQTRQMGYQNIAVIGNDCLDITPDIFATAFLKLKTQDLVIGPTGDGGFYLLATRCYTPQIFENVAWCCENVFQQICANAQQLQQHTAHLPCRSDIDSGRDLRQWIINALDQSLLAHLILSILKQRHQHQPLYQLPFIIRLAAEKQLWQLPPPTRLA